MGDDDEMEADRDAVSHKEHTFEFETFERVGVHALVVVASHFC